MSSKDDISDEDLIRLPQDGQKYELVDGEIRVSHAGARHGEVGVQLVILLGSHVRKQGLGSVLESSTRFRIPGRKPGQKDLRSPDVSFVAKGRFPEDKTPIRFVEFAPDLAVEVLAPDDRHREILEKVGQFLDAGTRLVWIIDPQKRAAAVYRSLTDVRRLGPEDDLDGEDVVPGFSCRLEDVLV